MAQPTKVSPVPADAGAAVMLSVDERRELGRPRRFVPPRSELAKCAVPDNGDTIIRRYRIGTSSVIRDAACHSSSYAGKDEGDYAALREAARCHRVRVAEAER